MASTKAKRLRLLDGAGGEESVESIRAGLAERLRGRRSELEEAIVARFLETGFDPALGEDAEYIAGARAAVAEAVDYGLTAIERGEEWLGSIPPTAVAQARRAARNSVSLERVLLRNNAGHALLGDFVMQEAEHSDLSSQRIALRHVLRTLGALLDHFTASIASEYQHEVERIAHSPELRRTQRVQRLLAGAPIDAGELGYEFDAEHLGMIAMGARAAESVRALAAGLGRQLLSVSRSEETVWAWFGGQQSPAITEIERLLSAREPAGVSLAIGGPGRGIDGWRLTHRQAQAAMLVALRRPQRLTAYADVALLAAVMRDLELARSLVAIHLSPLDSQRDGALSRETLRAYFAAGSNAATAAAALRVDRHTVERRLRTIETRLGRLLHTCHAELEVALRLEELGDLTVRTRRSDRARNPSPTH
jgi:PucR C-terminal helix-turn-helix domain/GGDEF-like domain